MQHANAIPTARRASTAIIAVVAMIATLFAPASPAAAHDGGPDEAFGEMTPHDVPIHHDVPFQLTMSSFEVDVDTDAELSVVMDRRNLETYELEPAGDVTVGNIVRVDRNHVTFDLTSSYPAGMYVARVTAGDHETLGEFFVAGPVGWVTPTSVEVDDTPGQVLDVEVSQEVFDAANPTVVLRRPAPDGTPGPEYPEGIGAFEVLSANHVQITLDGVVPQGPWWLDFTAGEQKLLALFEVVDSSQDLILREDVVERSTGVPHEMTATRDDDGTFPTDTEIDVQLWPLNGEVPIADAVSSGFSSSPLGITFELLQMPQPGPYRVVVTVGQEVLDDWLFIDEPMPKHRMALVTPQQVSTNRKAPTEMTVEVVDDTIEETGFSVVVTHIDARDADGQAGEEREGTRTSVEVGDVRRVSPTELAFDVPADAPQGGYEVAVTLDAAGERVVHGHFEVVRPFVQKLHPVRLSGEVQTLSLDGFGTGWDATTVVELFTADDRDRRTPIDGLSNLAIDTHDHLTVDLPAGMPRGGYVLRITTGTFLVLVPLKVIAPRAYVNPDVLIAGYPARDIAVTGYATTFDDATSSLTIETRDGDVVRTVPASDINVADGSTASFVLAAGLAPGEYRVVVDTAGRTVHAPLRVVAPKMTVDPQRLPAGYSAPRKLSIFGNFATFDETSTVELLQDGSPIPDAFGDLKIVDGDHLKVALRVTLEPGRYTVRVTTGGAQLTAPIGVVEAKVRPTSDTGSVNVEEDGRVQVTMPKRERSKVRIEREITCPDGSVPDTAHVRLGDREFPLIGVGEGATTRAVEIPEADVVAGALTLVVSCGDVETPEDLGEIVLYDPSGIVSDAVTGAPVIGAVVTLYRVPGWLPRQADDEPTEGTCESNLTKEDGADWSQEAPTSLGVPEPATSLSISPMLNPQVTNKIGYYGWDVAEGCWYVVVTRTGYDTLVSPVVGVPPEVTDLDLELSPIADTTPPTWESASLTVDSFTYDVAGMHWSSAGDEVGTNEYRVVHVTNGGDVELARTSGDVTAVTLAGLTPETEYSVRVDALDTAGNLAEGPVTSFTTLADRIAPQWRSSAEVVADEVTYDVAGMHWSSAGDEVGQTSQYHVVEVTPDGDVELTTTTGDVTSITLTGLSPSTTYTIRIDASDAEGNRSVGPTTTFTTTNDEPVERVSGDDRFSTAVAISADAFSPGVAVVYIASGRNFPDALAGGPAAANDDAPVLLVNPTSLPSATADELTRLAPGRIVVLGGESAVSADVFAALAEHTDGAVTRISGSNRYETAANISAVAFGTGVPVAYVATGANFPDALAGGAAAARDGGPVLLLSKSGIPSATAAELTRLAPQRIVILGGESAVSTATATALVSYTSGPVMRLSGSNRYATGVEISKTFSRNVDIVYVATGKNFPDALSGVPASGLTNAPILLIPGTSLPEVVTTELTRLSPRRIIILGGDAAVSPEVATQLQSYTD